MTSVCQFFGTFNRTTFYDEECQFTDSVLSLHCGLTFVNGLLALTLLGNCAVVGQRDVKRKKWRITKEKRIGVSLVMSV